MEFSQIACEVQVEEKRRHTAMKLKTGWKKMDAFLSKHNIFQVIREEEGDDGEDTYTLDR